jgi:integration host factor subunit beta
MNKLGLINALKDKCSISKIDATYLVDLFFAQTTDSLAKGERVEIRGLWSFFLKEYPAYTGRNPKTGKPIKISPKKLPFFRCGKDLKDRVDYPLN